MTPSTLLHPLKLDVVGFQEDEHDYHFRVELPEPKCCESCGTINGLVKFGKDDQAYRDVPIHDKRSTIWVIRRRYKCNSCASTFRPDLKDMDDRLRAVFFCSYLLAPLLTRTNSATSITSTQQTNRRQAPAASLRATSDSECRRKPERETGAALSQGNRNEQAHTWAVDGSFNWMRRNRQHDGCQRLSDGRPKP